MPKFGRIKAVARNPLFLRRAGRPFQRNSKGGDERRRGRITSISSPPVRRPTTAAQESGAYGGQGKAVGFPKLTALLSLKQPFRAGRHLAKNRNAVRSPCVITGQRHCYNLCEGRVGLLTLVATARGDMLFVSD
jgi:hypothetical protein